MLTLTPRYVRGHDTYIYIGPMFSVVHLLAFAPMFVFNISCCLCHRVAPSHHNFLTCASRTLQ